MGGEHTFCFDQLLHTNIILQRREGLDTCSRKRGPQPLFFQTQQSRITRLGTSGIEMLTISRGRVRESNQGWNALIRSLALDLSRPGTENDRCDILDREGGGNCATRHVRNGKLTQSAETGVYIKQTRDLCPLLYCDLFLGQHVLELSLRVVVLEKY